MGQCVGKHPSRKNVIANKNKVAVVQQQQSDSEAGPVNGAEKLKTRSGKSASRNNKDTSNGPAGGDSFKHNNKKSGKKTTADAFNRKDLEKLFEKYKEESTEDTPVADQMIGPDGLERFCTDMSIDPEDSVLLGLCFHLNASEMGVIYRDEWMSGFEKLQLDSIKKIKDYVNGSVRKDLEDPEKLKTVYKFVFNFAKANKDQKYIDAETAIGLLTLLLSNRFYHIKNFVEYLQTQTGTIKVINLDQWTSLYEFASTMKEDLSNYDENGAWPCIMDDYVQWMKSDEEEAEPADD